MSIADDGLGELLGGVTGDLLGTVAGDPLDYVVLRAVIEEAGKVGARRALGALGLEDERARRDMDELRELLVTWRDIRRSAWRTAIRWAMRGLLALLMVGMAVRLDVIKLVEA